MASYADLLQLRILAQEAFDNAVQLKPHLPPAAVSLRLSGGKFLSASSVFTSGTISAGAASRALMAAAQSTSVIPAVTDALFIDPVHKPASTADLLLLASHCTSGAQLHYIDNKDMKCVRMSDLVMQQPKMIAAIMPREEDDYTLTISGTGRLRETGVQLGFEVSYRNKIISAFPDPTDITPMRAALADIYHQYTDWNIKTVTIKSHRELPDPTLAMPLSGRDLQALSREAAPHTEIHFIACKDAQPITNSLSALMPAAYCSDGSKFQTHQHDLWQPVTASALNDMLDSDIQIETLKRQTAIFASNAPHEFAPRAAVALSQDDKTIGSSNLPMPPAGIPSCAENTALNISMNQYPNMQLKAVMQIIADDDHQPLSGCHASPCGLCRESIMQLCDDETIIILTDGKDKFEYCKAVDLLPQSRHGLAWHGANNPPHANPSFIRKLPFNRNTLLDDLHQMSLKALKWGRSQVCMAAYCKETETAYFMYGVDNAYRDCIYPPMIAQILTLNKLKADVFLMTSRDGNTPIGASLREGLVNVAADKNVFLYQADLKTVFEENGISIRSLLPQNMFAQHQSREV